MLTAGIKKSTAETEGLTIRCQVSYIMLLYFGSAHPSFALYVDKRIIAVGLKALVHMQWLF